MGMEKAAEPGVSWQDSPHLRMEVLPAPGRGPEAGECAKVHSTLLSPWEAARGLSGHHPPPPQALAAREPAGATLPAPRRGLCFQLQAGHSGSFSLISTRKEAGRRGAEKTYLARFVFPPKRIWRSLVSTGLGTKESWRFDDRGGGRRGNESDIHQAWAGMIITLRDPRQPSKLISCLLRLDGFLSPPGS